MSLFKKQLSFYFSCYALIAVIAVLSMSINVKTYTYINKRHELLIELQKIQEKNRDLDFMIKNATTLEKVEEIITTKLSMTAPSKLYFLD